MGKTQLLVLDPMSAPSLWLLTGLMKLSEIPADLTNMA